jgi:hypothetical protein
VNRNTPDDRPTVTTAARRNDRRERDDVRAAAHRCKTKNATGNAGIGFHHNRPGQHDTAEAADRPRTPAQGQAKAEQQRIDQGDPDLAPLQAF